MIFSSLLNTSKIKGGWWKILFLFFVGLFFFPLTITGVLSYGIWEIGKKHKKLLIVKIPIIFSLLFLGAGGTIAMYSDNSGTSSNSDDSNLNYKVSQNDKHNSPVETQQAPLVGKAENVAVSEKKNNSETNKPTIDTNEPSISTDPQPDKNNHNVGDIKEVVLVKAKPKEIDKQASALYPVVKVIDGDTLSVDIDGKIEVLRLMGINTPETVDPRKQVECFGTEASAKAKESLTGQRIRLEGDTTQGERDKYDINQAEQEARGNKRGLWADDTCDGKLTAPTSSQSVSQQEQEGTTPTPIIPSISTCECESNKYNCPDFKTHAEAQAVYECCLKKVGIDAHRLDQDKDGLACEGLP
ncbi:MAG: Micrococcal nuclease [Parcubacteria group bacterium GW2011_GWA2_44_12]|nr:MAG: Micrococcal nuclease [Parcubacteria group bacterium GW2011_GWA2_44_12]